MDYAFMFISAIVILICVYLVISPFFTRVPAVESANELGEEKTIEAIYSAVNELEMEYLMKKISEQDFNELKSKYEAMATKYLSREREISRNPQQNKQATDDIDEQLLKELAEIRRTHERGN